MNILKSIGGLLLGLAGMIAVVLIIFLLVSGGAWLADKVYPWLIIIFALALVVCVFILLPLAIFRKTRGFSGIGIYIASYVFGITLWVWCLLTVYTLWGGFAVVIGILMAGIGIVPLAIIASLTKGLWSIAIQMVVIGLVTWGARLAALALAESAEAHRQV
jgi:hypothetical protein